jgi:hypothetical protein
MTDFKFFAGNRVPDFRGVFLGERERREPSRSLLERSLRSQALGMEISLGKKKAD